MLQYGFMTLEIRVHISLANLHTQLNHICCRGIITHHKSDVLTRWAFTLVLVWTMRLKADTTILTVMILACSTLWICWFHWQNFTESSTITIWTQTFVTVYSIFTCSPVKTYMCFTVINIFWTVFTFKSWWTVTSVK